MSYLTLHVSTYNVADATQSAKFYEEEKLEFINNILKIARVLNLKFYNT